MIKEIAYAKINIGLNIIDKRSDGYHNIDTIMQSITLFDEIILEKSPGITITCPVKEIPLDETNTAYKAANSFFKRACIDFYKTGVQIHIVKNIPSKAGLGGGSSDAAAVLHGLNKIYSTNYSTTILRELALEVGSDVPFCIEGGTQRALGRGEILKKLTGFDNTDLVVLMPNESVDTKNAYMLFSKTPKPYHPNMNSIETAVINKNITELGLCMGNTFEHLVFPDKPLIEKAMHDILNTGAKAGSMTGSGSAVFGFFQSYEEAFAAFLKLKGKYLAYIAKTKGEI